MADPATDEAQESVADDAVSGAATDDEAAEDVRASEEAGGIEEDAKLIATLRQVAVDAAVSALTPVVKEIVTKAAENAVKRAPELLADAGGVQGLTDRARGRIEEAGGMSAFMTQTRARLRRRPVDGGASAELEEDNGDPVIDVEFEEEELEPLDEEESAAGEPKEVPATAERRAARTSTSAASKASSGSRSTASKASRSGRPRAPSASRRAKGSTAGSSRASGSRSAKASRERGGSSSPSKRSSSRAR